MNIPQFVALIFILTFFCSCEEEAIKITTANCNSNTSYESHPKHATYQALLDQFVSNGLVGVNVLIDQAGEEVWAGSAGVISIENNQYLELCNIFPTASLSKMYCGVATMQVFEEGLIDLYVPIDQYLPNHLIDKVPNAHLADIANLLSHTSGIPDYADNPNLILDFFNDKGLDFSREAILEEYVYGKEPKFKPGTEYSYSNSNYEILTIILDHVLGYHHADWYSNHIFAPLAFSNTYYKNETDYTDLNEQGMAQGYFDRHSDGKLENATDMSLSIASGQTGSDGIITDIQDLYSFLKSIFEAEIISPNTLGLMKEYIKVKHNFITYKYGLGIAYRDEEKNFGLERSIGHSGSLPGYAAEAWFFPDSETYIVFISNTGNILNGPLSETLDDFREALYKEVLTE